MHACVPTEKVRGTYARQRTAWRFRPSCFPSLEKNERCARVLFRGNNAAIQACLAKQSVRRRHVNQGTRRRRPLRQAARETGRNNEGKEAARGGIYVSCSEVVTEVYVTFSHRAADRLLFFVFGATPQRERHPQFEANVVVVP